MPNKTINILKKHGSLLLHQEIPFSIYLEEGIFIEAKAVENNKPVYAVIKDLLHPSENSDIMFYNEIITSFNLDNARLGYSSGLIVNPDLGFPSVSTNANRNANYLLLRNQQITGLCYSILKQEI
jgi:hypothetical protein